MKKISFLLGAALLGVTAANAQDADVVFANPTLEDGSFIVKYDLEKGAFCESNDFEIDETFVFAIDVTGTPYATALTEPSRNPNILGRGMAHDFYVNNDVCAFEHYQNGGNLDGRLFHIKDNIYGATFNLFQLATGRYKDSCYGLYTEDGVDKYDALKEGAVVTFGSNLFGFGWSATNPGEEWWDAISAPITNLWFHTAPYTGTKTSPDFYFDDFHEGSVFEGCESTWADKGYAMPEDYSKAVNPDAVEAIAEDYSNAKAEYFTLHGIHVANPEHGIFIRRQGNKVSKVAIR